jgi:hypothetical protein
VRFSPIQFRLGVFNLLRGQAGAYEIRGDLDLSTRFGPLRLSYQQSGKIAFS